MKHIPISVLVLLLLVAAARATAGEYWSDIRLSIADASRMILIRHGACADKQDCQRKELVLAGGSLSGTEIYYYGVTDSTMIGELTSVLTAEHLKDKSHSLTAKFFKKSHKEMNDYSWLSAPKPFVLIELAGE